MFACSHSWCTKRLNHTPHRKGNHIHWCLAIRLQSYLLKKLSISRVLLSVVNANHKRNEKEPKNETREGECWRLYKYAPALRNAFCSETYQKVSRGKKNHVSLLKSWMVMWCLRVVTKTSCVSWQKIITHKDIITNNLIWLFIKYLNPFHLETKCECSTQPDTQRDEIALR